MTAPYEGFHNMVFSEESTVGAFCCAHAAGLRDFGACMSPHTAWLILQGIETLPLRMEQHMRNTEKVVQFLASQPFVERVGHPLLGIAPQPPARAKAAAARRAGGVQLRPQGHTRTGQEVHRTLKLFSHLANVGDCRSLVIHPASTTHFRLSTTRSSARASRRARSACPSAWKTRTTSSTTSSAPSRPRKRQEPDHGTASQRPPNLLLHRRQVFNPAQPTVVMIHGVLNDHSVWAMQSRYLANHGWNVLAVDLPGHCKSVGPAPASVEEAADFIIALLDAVAHRAPRWWATAGAR